MKRLAVRKVSYEVVAPWRARAARDGVALGPTANTTWYGAFRGVELVGVGGIIRIGGRARLKGIYVPTELRGQGIGQALTDARIAAVPDDVDIEVLAYDATHWQGRGFEAQGEYRPGVTRLLYARPGRAAEHVR